jgi:ATP-dependent Lon protease
MANILINDEELAKLIETYCREKIRALQQEIEEL